MGELAHYCLLARYNWLANERLYAACAAVPDAELRADRGAFFGSIHGTLNHILVGDRIWLARFQGRVVPSTGLDAILYEAFDDLRAARTAQDAEIDAFAAGLTADFLDGSVAYVNNENRQFNDPIRLLLPHFFNHQTHHRGQVTDLLARAGAATPVLDMHRVIKPDP